MANFFSRNEPNRMSVKFKYLHIFLNMFFYSLFSIARTARSSIRQFTLRFMENHATVTAWCVIYLYNFRNKTRRTTNDGVNKIN